MADSVDERFARRVTAVLVAEREPATTAAGRDDTISVDDAVVFLRAARGDAEVLSPTAVVAVFDDAAAGLTAATRLHVHAAGDGGDGARIAWRAGIHVGELLMTGEGSASLAAIDRASALARLARPGTTAVTADALPVLGRVREATLEQRTPEGQVHRVVPQQAAPVSGRRRAMVLLLGGAA